jgi:hypothetical protein
MYYGSRVQSMHKQTQGDMCMQWLQGVMYEVRDADL